MQNRMGAAFQGHAEVRIACKKDFEVYCLLVIELYKYFYIKDMNIYMYTYIAKRTDIFLLA